MDYQGSLERMDPPRTNSCRGRIQINKSGFTDLPAK